MRWWQRMLREVTPAAERAEVRALVEARVRQAQEEWPEVERLTARAERAASRADKLGPAFGRALDGRDQT